MVMVPCLFEEKTVIIPLEFRWSMSDKDTTQQHMQTVTVGQFEFTSIPLSSIEAKKGADYAQDHV